MLNTVENKYHFFCSGCDHYFQNKVRKAYCNSCGKRMNGDRPDEHDFKENERLFNLMEKQ